MTLPRSGIRLRPIGLVVMLLALGLLLGACAKSAATPEAGAAEAAAPEAVAAEATATPTAAPATEGATVDVPVGVDADGNFYRGKLDAPVKMEEFSEFQCPFCARHFAQTESQLRNAYVATGQLLHIFRNFPLDSIHPNATPAALAAYCAGQQDPKLFWSMHDWLFANQDTWSAASDAAAQFRAQAVAEGADGAKYDACLTDVATQTHIQNDLNEGLSRGVQGTPSFFINDFFISGAYPFSEFQDKIERALRGEKPAPTPTPLPQGVEFYYVDPARPGFTYDGSPTMGSAEAPVLLIAFEDFKSKDAAAYALEVEPTLKSKFIDTNQLRVMFMYYPPDAPKAAAAAYCAGQQGKFWEFRTALYKNQASWNDGDAATLTGYATALGLNEAQFTSCLTDPATLNAVSYSYEFAQQQIGVPTAPSFLLLKLSADGIVENGRGIEGTLSLADFEQAIRDIQLPPTPVPTQPPPVSQAQLASMEVGVDADGHFYRGNLNAPIRLVDFSDFQ
ncbi:MAG: Disulfide bond formation protein D precursor [Chloroflexi bacterium ADurb.Bin325]|nr:MAG: Disulfide bond formation protein D precursor [Chloroflexi bacterium ADurb.Bin325]